MGARFFAILRATPELRSVRRRQRGSQERSAKQVPEMDFRQRRSDFRRRCRRSAFYLILGSMWGVILFGLAACGGASSSESFDAAAEETAIRQLLQRQVEAWNRGDLERFMEGYVHSDSLRFASGARVRRGWTATLERYRKSYPDRAAMGTLTFDQLDVRVLSPQWATVFGAWRLERENDAPHGLFTLLLKRRAGRWRIVHDHTSSAPE